MADDKKMNELSDDELEQAAGGRVYERVVKDYAGKDVSQWVAASDNWHGGPEGKTFSTESEAVNYAKKRGWDTTSGWW